MSIDVNTHAAGAAFFPDSVRGVRAMVRLPVGLMAFGLSTLPMAALACPPAQKVSTMPLDPASVSGRFTALLERDKDADPDGSAKLWSALIDDAKSDTSTSPEILARSYGWLAWAMGSTADAGRAAETARTGENIVVAKGLIDAPWNAELLSLVSMTDTTAGAFDMAERNGMAALALAQRNFGSESAEVGLANFALGFVANARGQFVEAEHFGDVASTLFAKCLPANDSFIVDAISSHAAGLDAVGRAEEALTENERAANWALSNLPENNTGTTFALSNLAVSLRNAGRLSEAEAVLRRVLDRQQLYEPTNWFSRATQLSNFATTINSQGRHEEAEALWLRAREWHLKAYDKSDPITLAYPLRFAADAAEARGDLKLALARRSAAIAAIEKDTPAGHPQRALARLEYAATLGRMHLKSNSAAAALGMATPQMAILRAKLVPDSVRRLGAEIAYAKIVARASGTTQGYALAAPQAALLEAKLLDTSTARGDLVRYGPVLSSTFATVADLAFASGHQSEGFRALQLANLSDIVLVNSDLAVRLAAASPASATMARALQDHIRERQLLDSQRSYAVTAKQEGETARIAAAIAANDVATAALTETLDRDFPQIRALGRPTPVSLAAYSASLGDSDILVAPLPVDDGTLAITVTRVGLTWKKTPFNRAQIAALTARVRRSVADMATTSATSAAFDTAAANSLLHAIVPDIGVASFKRHPHMLYYASGALATIPPALLVERSANRATRLANVAWLVRTHDTTILPTLASLTTSVPRTARAERFLGVGAPLLGNVQIASSRGLPFRSGAVDMAALRNLPSLPGARAELDRMQTILGSKDSLTLIGANATETMLTSMQLDQYTIIAFATHGLMSGDFAGLREPALVLTPPDHPTSENDGMLTSSKIAALHLNADWVILSACNSADGSGSAGPAYSGLAAAFVQAGARSLLVSHWPVRDDAAAQLTVATVQNTQAGATRAVALQHAMLSLLSDRKVPHSAHPAIWAPFVLIGR